MADLPPRQGARKESEDLKQGNKVFQKQRKGHMMIKRTVLGEIQTPDMISRQVKNKQMQEFLI